MPNDDAIPGSVNSATKIPLMALTPELVALCERVEIDPGPDPSWGPRASDETFQGFAARLMAEKLPGPLWLFAYGSLIWKREFETVEQKRGTARGWHRSFCIELPRWRGSPQQPGLMMALDHGGTCEGIVYQLSAVDLQRQLVTLLEREIHNEQDFPTIRWVSVSTRDGPLRALTFWAGPTGEGIKRKLPLEHVAWTIARACGHIGSNASYLHTTVSHLDQFGIRDRNLWRLQQLVADEVRRIHQIA